jgi:hypothetical protein
MPFYIIVLAFAVLVDFQRVAFAAEPLSDSAGAKADFRYGPIRLFDRRSQYGKGVFPEPFLVDDSDLEHNEWRLDWLHQETRGTTADNARVEVEKGFGLMTLELELPYQSTVSRAFDPVKRRTTSDRQTGIGNFSVGVRHPVYQFVSQDESIDDTFGAALEIGIPTDSPVSKHAEIVPKIFNDLRLGDHFTIQTVLGYSFLRGSKPEGGAEAFEYGLVFGYALQHRELPLPGVEQCIPVFELKGETATNQGAAGHNTLRGDAAIRFNLKAIGPIQPRLGIGYVFPIDQGARNEFRWGVYTSLVFDF